jgi:hypothetical protein
MAGLIATPQTELAGGQNVSRRHTKKPRRKKPIE